MDKNGSFGGPHVFLQVLRMINYGWRFGLAVTRKRVGRDQQVTLCQARLTLGWVTVCGQVGLHHLGL